MTTPPGPVCLKLKKDMALSLKRSTRQIAQLATSMNNWQVSRTYLSLRKHLGFFHSEGKNLTIFNFPEISTTINVPMFPSLLGFCGLVHLA
jgi:hypothetical protein